jgi:hypothetical protein
MAGNPSLAATIDQARKAVDDELDAVIARHRECTALLGEDASLAGLYVVLTEDYPPENVVDLLLVAIARLAARGEEKP